MKLSELLVKVIDLFYIPPINRLVSPQTFRYAACGGGNMVLDMILYFITYHFVLGGHNLDLWWMVFSPHIAAQGIVFPITLFNGFWLNRNVAFRHSPLAHGIQAIRYLLSVGGALLLSVVFIKLFVDVMHIDPILSKALSTAITIVYSYLMQKYFTFRGYTKI